MTKDKYIKILEKCQTINENDLCCIKCSITISLYSWIFNLFCFDYAQRVNPQITKLQSKQKQAKYFLVRRIVRIESVIPNFYSLNEQ